MQPVFKAFTTSHRAALAELSGLGVVVEIKALRTYVRGRNTYPIRDALKQLGFRWHPNQRMWSALGRLDPDHLPRLVEAHRANERVSEVEQAGVNYAGAVGLLTRALRPSPVPSDITLSIEHGNEPSAEMVASRECETVPAKARVA